MSIINILSIHLQSSTLDIIKCLNLIESTITELKLLRSDELFNKFYEKSEIMASKLNISIPNNYKRETNINRTLTDYVITSTIGFKSNKTSSQKMRVLYYTVIDNILSEMDKMV